jgi:hypothetical protein
MRMANGLRNLRIRGGDILGCLVLDQG